MGQVALALGHGGLLPATKGLSPPSGRFATSCAASARTHPHRVLHFTVERGLDFQDDADILLIHHRSWTLLTRTSINLLDVLSSGWRTCHPVGGIRLSGTAWETQDSACARRTAAFHRAGRLAWRAGRSRRGWRASSPGTPLYPSMGRSDRNPGVSVPIDMTRPSQERTAGSARTSKRLRASRPQAMATRWTVWP